MIIRLLIALAAAGVTVLSLVLTVVRSDGGSQQLCALAAATLRETTGEPVAVGHCLVDPVRGLLSIENAVFGPAENPRLSAERLGLSVSAVMAGATGRLRIDAVEVVRPHVSLDLSEPSATPAGRRQRAVSADCLPDFGLLELGHVTLSDGRLTLALPGGHALSGEGFSFSAREERRRLLFQIEVRHVSLTGPLLSLEVERGVLRGWFHPEDGTARLEALDVSTPEGSLFVQADLASVCTLRGTGSATARVDLTTAGRSFLRIVPRLEGRAELRASGSFNIAGGPAPAYAASVDARFSELAVSSVRPGELRVSAEVDPSRLHVRSMELPLESGTLRGAGTLELTRPYPLDAKLQFESLVLGELLARVGVPDLKVHLSAHGSAHVAGPLSGGLRLATTLDAQVSDFAVLDRSWRARGAANRRVRLDKGRLGLRLVVAGDHVLLQEARVDGSGNRLAVRGLIDYRRGLNLEVAAPAVVLEELGPFGSVAVGGRGSLTGRIAGPYGALDIEASTEVSDLRVRGLELGDVRAAVRIGPDEVRVDLAEGRRGATVYRGHALLDLAWPASLNGEITLGGGTVADLLGVASGRYESVAALAGRLDGAVQGRLSVSGPLHALDAVADLDLARVTAWGQSFPSGELLVALIGGEKLEINDLRLRTAGSGRLRARGTLTLDDLRHEVTLVTENLRAEDLPAIQAAVRNEDGSGGVEGAIALELVSEGPVSAPRARGWMVLRDWYRGAQPLWTAHLGLTVSGGRAELDGKVFSPWPRELQRPRISGDAPPEAEPALPPGSMRHTVRGTVGLRRNLPFVLDLDLDVPDVRALASAELLGGAEAGIGGRVHARGDLLRPRDVEALLQLDRLWAKRGRWMVRNSGPVVAVYEQGRLFLEAFPVGGPGFSVEAFGVREPDGALDFTVRGRAVLELLRGVVGGLDEARGRLDLDVSLSGRQEKPVIVGYARLDGATLRPEGALVTLENASGHVTFSPEALVISGLEGQLNGGPVEVAGTVEMESFRPRRVDLRMLLGEIPLRLEGIPLVIAGAPTISGTLGSGEDDADQLRLGGEIEVVRFRFQRDIELERALVQALELARRPPAPQVFEKSGEFLTLDLGIRLGDVRIDNNLVKTGLRGDLRLTGTNRRPGLLGTVTLAGGRAFVRGNEFAITSGVLSFTDRSRIRPTFDIRADAHVRDYDVRVQASGTPQQPRILLASEPPLPEADIVTLLTLGVTTRDFEDTRAGGASLGGFLVDAAYNASGINQQVRGLLSETELLKDATFRVTSAYSEVSGNIEPIALFETKFLLDGLKLRAQTSLLGSRGRRAQAEYRIDDRMSAQAQWDGDNPSAGSIGDLGGDLKLQWEVP